MTQQERISEIILQLKQIREERNLSLEDVHNLVISAGGYTSMSSVRRVFAKGSENQKFRYQDTIKPIVQGLLGVTEETPENNDITAAHKVAPLDKVLDAMTKELKMHHIQRVQAGQCTLELGFVYNDSLNNIGRVAGHCANIAVAVLETEDINLRSHNYLNIIDMEEYRTHLADYTEKYLGALKEAESAE
jgi:hypothetical protein